MKVLTCKNPVFFDVDDTLVKWGVEAMPHEERIPIACPVSKVYLDGEETECPAWTEFLVPHRKHIQKLIEYKKKGSTIVVWSKGGEVWAAAVCKALKIDRYVDLVIEKPSKYYDDLEAKDFMGKREFYKDEEY
jgi:phosphoserine phosphatase